MHAIRDLDLEDLEALLALYAHLHPSDVAPPESSRAEAIWQRLCSSSDHSYLGAVVDGALVASCALTTIPNLTRGGRPYALVENVVTHANYRRQGLGRAVVSEALARCWRRDCYKVMLMAGIDQFGVHAFYQALGFEKQAKQAFLARPL